jgi:hypothetical protein
MPLARGQGEQFVGGQRARFLLRYPIIAKPAGGS